MTKLHFFLYLTTTLSFALLAAGNSNCPGQHPYAYDNGNRCCETNWENQGQAPNCKGRMLSISSSCCEGANVQCPQKPCKNYGGCQSEGCKALVKTTNEFMDPNIDPCNNFALFTCGNYLKRVQIPPEYNRFTESFEGNTVKIFIAAKKMLEELPTKPTNFTSDSLASDFYQSCTNLAKIESLKFSPLENLLNKYGGWPAVIGSSWNVPGYDLWKHATTLAVAGISTDFILTLDVNIDLKNSTRRTIYLDQASVFLPVAAYGSDHVLAIYYKYMVEAAMLMGAKNDTAHRDMREVLNFETALARISASGRRDLKKIYNQRTLQDLEGKPGYPPSLTNYINTLFAGAGVSVDKSDTVIVKNLEYVKNLSAIISATSDRTLANYLSWRTYAKVDSYLPKDARMTQFRFWNRITGQKEPVITWKRCIMASGMIRSSKEPKSLSLPTTSLYVRNYFPKDNKRRANKIIDETTASFRYMLERLEWMDNQTKEFAIKKLDKMRRTVGFTDDLLRPDLIDKFFSGLNLNGTYFNNELALKLFWRHHSYQKLRLPVGKDDWTVNNPVVMSNAFYDTSRNLMVYSAGILGGIFFDSSLPDSLNLATMGAVTGHEMLHGFDDQGRLFDSEGKLFNWWKNSTEQKFENRKDCIIKQYGNYTHPQVNMTLNGVNTQGENIADTSGLMAAYAAFQNSKKHHDPLLVDGQYYSPEQWFFIRYGHLWCGKERDQVLKLQIANDRHPPLLFRVKGAVSNHPNFAEAFRCPPGSPMNPVKKCRVW